MDLGATSSVTVSNIDFLKISLDPALFSSLIIVAGGDELAIVEGVRGREMTS